MIQFYDGDFKKLFNTSGQVYRKLKLSEKMKVLSAGEAVELLSSDGMLVKRPFVLSEHVGRVGFKETDWKPLV